jgi:arsenate reductase
MVIFVCLHGSAKSLIAAEHFSYLARARGLPLSAESVGVEPDAAVPVHVVAGLAADGIDIHGYIPRQASPDAFAAAAHVVSFGCDLGSFVPPETNVDRWDDLPAVSDGYAPARDAIVQRVEALLDRLS